jgi:hypothetical protein
VWLTIPRVSPRNRRTTGKGCFDVLVGREQVSPYRSRGRHTIAITRQSIRPRFDPAEHVSLPRERRMRARPQPWSVDELVQRLRVALDDRNRVGAHHH